MSEIKIYALVGKDLKEENGKLVVDITRELQTINMGDTFFMKLFASIYKINTNFVEDIIKVFIPDQHAEKLLADGLYMNNEKYIAYTSTPSLQKKQTLTEKTEFIFINEKRMRFIELFEQAISLNKFKEKFEGKNIPIAKKVTSRTALAFSDVTKINCFQPRILIVDNFEDYVPCTIDTVETTGAGEKRNIVTDENGQPKIIRDMMHEIKYTRNDGMGLMSLTTADAIKQSMGLEYDVYFAVIRMYNGTATKGLCLTFDYVSYFEEYNKDCKGKYGCYTIKDWKGVERDIREYDLILTTSQAKWCGNWDSLEEIENRLSKVKRDDLRYMLGSLYVTKVNKDPKKLATHTLSNYQLIGNLDITYKQYKELADDTFNLYKGVIDGDMNCIKTFLKDFTECNTVLNEDGETSKEVDGTNDEVDVIQPSTIAETLLNINQDFYKLEKVKSTLRKLVRKKIYNLASGRIYIKGLYTYLSQDPIFMLNKLIGIETDGELASNEYYCNGLNQEFLSQRCPCNSFNEIVTFTTSSNAVYDKYLSHIGREIVVYNAKSLTSVIQSTADFDGDGVLLSDEKVLIDGVVKTKSFFYNLEDGDVKEEVYNRENMIKSLYNCGGNLIGKIALQGGQIANNTGSFESKLPMLYATLLASQIAIDCPKTCINVPKNMTDFIDEKLEKVSKPYYMRWRNTANNKVVYDKDKYIEHKDCQSVLDRYAKYVLPILLNKDGKEGGHEVKTIFNKMQIPHVKLDYECVKSIQALYNDMKAELDKIGAKYKEDNAELLEMIKESEESLKKASLSLRSINKQIDDIDKYPDDYIVNDEALNDMYYERDEAKKHKKYCNSLLNKYKKKLKPADELKKAMKGKVKAEKAIEALDIIDKFGGDSVVKALLHGREDGKNYTLSFILDCFFELVTKYMVCENAYKLQITDSDVFDFEHLGHRYIRKHLGLSDSHMVAQGIVARLNKASKAEKLGIESGEVSIGFIDPAFGREKHMELKGKTLDIVLNGSYVQLALDGEVVAFLRDHVIKGVDMRSVKSITIIDVEQTGKSRETGKSAKVWFVM